MSEGESEMQRLLRELFGDRADEALGEMRRMGMDPDALAAATGMAETPAMMEHVLAQLRSLLEQSAGEDVNWKLARDVARGVAAHGGDPSVTAAQASEYREAVSKAELWLDAATDMEPSTLAPHVWSRAEWVEATLPTWRTVAGPVAVSVSRALTELMNEDGEAGGLMAQVAPTVTGMHVGEAAGALAREAFGGTDLGLLLVPEPRAVMVPRTIEGFSEGLDIPDEEVRAFLALRECAHVRLFRHAPWLAGQLIASIESYARDVRIDPRALDEAVQQAGIGDPARLQKAMSAGIFASSHTDAQEATLASIETLLALIEGWVETVTTVAAAPHVKNVPQLIELMRRRRAAGGPAEDTFAALLGLELRPRRLRDAAELWMSLAARDGASARDSVWSHPDLLPDADALVDPMTWLDARGGDDVDRELRDMLDGDA